jgi:hypothetical protein
MFWGIGGLMEKNKELENNNNKNQDIKTEPKTEPKTEIKTNQNIRRINNVY